MARFGNPFSFTPVPVTFFTSIIYIGLFAVLIVNHYILPSTPSKYPEGVDLTAAWNDLQNLTSYYHPYNSKANDDARTFLLDRISEILTTNKASFAVERDRIDGVTSTKRTDLSSVIVIDDLGSNVTSSRDSLSVYFEGSNIIVSIKGTDDEGHCYQDNASSDAKKVKGGVLVNAHFDSVSTGFGATDDGVGIVTILQLLSYFTTPGNEPTRCLVLLLNNGEEDYLNGARAFMRHPVSQTPHTFLNLEGAGAGGKAILFRATDTEVARFYKKAKNPFGTVVTADGFEQGAIRSQTDYVVFNGDLGLRGLDVAFFEPRAKYHTMQDSTIETSKQSVWNMLSASLGTVKAMVSDTSDHFSGQPEDGKVKAGDGSRVVYFDLFTQVLAVFELHTLFAWSVTLLVVTPIMFIVLTIFLSRADKMYLWARRGWVHSSNDDHFISFNGIRGFFRYPMTIAIATAATIALAYLYAKVNPLIAYSSEYSVWASMIAAWFFVAWMGLRASDEMRPTALQRIYALLWIYIASFALLVLATISENNFHLAGGYFLVIYFASVSIALLLSFLEMFALPKKADYVALMDGNGPDSRPPTSGTNHRSNHGSTEHDDDATETTSLLQNDRQSFARYGSRRASQDVSETTSDDRPPAEMRGAYGEEQPWSCKLPSSVWLLQFLLLGPINIVLIGQIALTITAGLHQTGADGSSILAVYLFIAILTVLLLIPITPFLHRFHYHFPTFLLLILIGTLAYNLVAFPFSPNNRLKLFFLQRVDCDTGATSVSLTGAQPFVEAAISNLPSASGHDINCTSSDAYTSSRNGLTSCIWPGLPAHPVTLPSNISAIHSRRSYESKWFNFDIETTGGKNTATFYISALDTKNCRIYFDTPVKSLHIANAASDSRFSPVGENGAREVRLWSRTFHAQWNVSVAWDTSKNTGLSGHVVCLYADANAQGAIPALEEIWRFLPNWAIVTKAGDGLVEGWKKFEI
ncbi:putative zinc metalloprotease [Pseudovirgaria hyperparasitica]|uniref:Peptide hydrolase n=1 Tax=Pseudovirgaria hyperparasitica TaxID=470096 RepID=A0A6A6W5R4_9PEZI|nr:putative zinc metalloprotease [Pseudovirgaria hyperparasitica]KAF2757885.1 putative zinc metalloprotease [Pseudovirgaria hyperparasitica]